MTAPASPLKSISVSDPVLADLMDQLANRLQAGEPLDVEDFLRAHPERSEELRRLLPAVEILADLERSVDPEAISISQLRAPSVSDGSQSREGERPEHGVLGDFRIIREIGRGGMGIVYEAEQISLGRRIALKVLPFASTLDPRQLQRFKNEAHAAAQLHHTNIVPVFATGCERGVHFYAMQFIDGQTLADIIHQQRTNSASGASDRPGLDGSGDASTPASGVASAPRVLESENLRALTQPRSPETAVAAQTERAPRDSAAFRQIAEWGIQAALALEYAHSLGIIHRDIKPANLLIENPPLITDHSPRPDHSPLTTHHSLRLWITDFGLAHCQSQAGITMTGDLLGTLRYMSPEQALAKQVSIDHRTDIYSLGLTLYELLTLQPAFSESDRAKLLHQIAFQDPLHPRRVNPSIPAELETIVLKAIEKEPQDRYPSAQELANDLRRFLEDKPIQARKPTFRQRITKWTRRHPSAVWAGVSALLIAVVALAISTFFVAQAQARTKAALKEAEDNYEAAEEQRQVAVENARVAQRERLRSGENFHKACEWVMQLLRRFGERDLSDLPQIKEVRASMTDLALRLFLNALNDPEVTPDAAPEMASLALYVAVASQDQWELQKTVNAYQEAIRRAKMLTTHSSEPSSDYSGLGQCHVMLANFLFSKGLTRDALLEYQQAHECQRKAVELNPQNSSALNLMAWYLAICPVVELRRLDEAVEFAKRAVALAPAKGGLWNTLGVAHYRSGQWPDAVRALEESFRLNSANRFGLFSLANQENCYDLFYLAMANWQLGEKMKAREWFDRGARKMQANPNDGEFQELHDEAAKLLGVPSNPRKLP